MAAVPTAGTAELAPLGGRRPIRRVPACAEQPALGMASRGAVSTSSLALQEDGSEARLQRPAVLPQTGSPKLAETPHCPAASSPRTMAPGAGAPAGETGNAWWGLRPRDPDCHSGFVAV